MNYSGFKKDYIFDLIYAGKDNIAFNLVMFTIRNDNNTDEMYFIQNVSDTISLLEDMKLTEFKSLRLEFSDGNVVTTDKLDVIINLLHNLYIGAFSSIAGIFNDDYLERALKSIH